MRKFNSLAAFVGLLIGVFGLAFWFKSWTIAFVLGGSVLSIGWFIKSVNQTSEIIKTKPKR